MKNTSFAILCLLVFIGCQSTPQTEERSTLASNETFKPIPSLLMTCRSPYRLTQDCSSLSGGKRKVIVDGKHYRVAASPGGDLILVQPDVGILAKGNVLSGWHRNSPVLGVQSFRDTFSKQGIPVQWVRYVGDIDDQSIGFLIKVNGNGYATLSARSDTNTHAATSNQRFTRIKDFRTPLNGKARIYSQPPLLISSVDGTAVPLYFGWDVVDFSMDVEPGKHTLEVYTKRPDGLFAPPPSYYATLEVDVRAGLEYILDYRNTNNNDSRKPTIEASLRELAPGEKARILKKHDRLKPQEVKVH